MANKRTEKKGLKFKGLFAKIHYRKDGLNTDFFFLTFHYDINIKGRKSGTVKGIKTPLIKLTKKDTKDTIIHKRDVLPYIRKAQKKYNNEIIPNIEEIANDVKITTEQVINDFIKSKIDDDQIGDITLRNLKPILNRLLNNNTIPKYWNDVIHEHFKTLLTDLKNKLKPSSWNRHLSTYKSLDKWSADEYETKTKIKNIKPLPIGANDHWQAPTINNKQNFIKAINDYTQYPRTNTFKELNFLCLLLPLRFRELLNIQVNDVDFKEEIINLDKTKTIKDGLKYPLTDTLANVFKGIIKRDNLKDNDYIFRDLKKHYATDDSINGRINRERYETNFKNTFHGLRKVIRSFIATKDAQEMLNISMSDAKLYGAIVLTHKSKGAIEEIYNNVNELFQIKESIEHINQYIYNNIEHDEFLNFCKN